MEKQNCEFAIGDTVIAQNNKPLEGNDKAPALTVGAEYPVKNIIYDNKGFPHLDVGLKSELNFVTSWHTAEELPDGDTIHWCHPSRFTKKNV